MSTLKIYGGLDVKKRARILPDAAAVVGEDDFKKLKRKLNNHSLPTKNKHHARFTFSRQLPEAGEIIVSYTAWLSEKAKDCKFDNQINNRTLEHLIQMIRDNDLIKKSIPKNGTLTNSLKKQAREMISTNNERYERQLQDIQSKKEKKMKRSKYCDNCSKVGLHPPGQNYKP